MWGWASGTDNGESSRTDPGVQGPVAGLVAVAHTCDRCSGRVGSVAFVNCQMPVGDVAVEAEQVAQVGGNLVGAPPLHSGDVWTGEVRRMSRLS